MSQQLWEAGIVKAARNGHPTDRTPLLGLNNREQLKVATAKLHERT